MLRAKAPTFRGQPVWILQAEVGHGMVGSYTSQKAVLYCHATKCAVKIRMGEQYVKWGETVYCGKCAVAMSLVGEDGKPMVVGKEPAENDEQRKRPSRRFVIKTGEEPHLTVVPAKPTREV